MQEPTTRNPIIIVGGDTEGRQYLRKTVASVTHYPEGIIFTKDLLASLKEMKSFKDIDTEIDLVLTDLFLGEEFNIFAYIRLLEKSPKFWNIPLLIYTHGIDKELFNRITRDIVHIPFRVVLRSYDDKVIREACKGLLEFKKENQHFLNLTAKLAALVKAGDSSIIPSTLKVIDKYAEKYGKVFSVGKALHLKGQLYYDFAKQKKDKLEPLEEKLEKYTPAHNEFKLIKKKIIELTRDHGDYIFEAEKIFLESYRKAPRYWQNLLSLYNLYMEQNDLKEAKKYLSELIRIFPEQSKYSFSMGKIHELEGDFTSAVEHYINAWKSFTKDGITGYDTEDVMEVVDASLESSKNMLNEMSLSKFSTEEHDVGSIEYTLIRTLKQHNAMTRSALVHIAKEAPGDPEVFNKIGITYRRTGDYSMSVEMYSKALDIDPDNTRIRINYSVALALKGSWDNSMKEMQKVKAKNADPEDSKIIKRLWEVITKHDSDKLSRMLI